MSKPDFALPEDMRWVLHGESVGWVILFTWKRHDFWFRVRLDSAQSDVDSACAYLRQKAYLERGSPEGGVTKGQVLDFRL